MISNNVIIFPKNKTEPDSIELPTTIDEITYSLEQIKLLHIDEVVDYIISSTLDKLYVAGFKFEDVLEDDNAKHITLLSESLKSLLCKYYNIDHNLQVIAEQIFVINEDKTIVYKQKEEVNDNS